MDSKKCETTNFDCTNSCKHGKKGSVTGKIIFTAANGDELHTTASGTVVLGGASKLTLTVVAKGSTGRFSDATGTIESSGTWTPEGIKKGTYTVDETLNGSVGY